MPSDLIPLQSLSALGCSLSPANQHDDQQVDSYAAMPPPQRCLRAMDDIATPCLPPAPSLTNGQSITPAQYLPRWPGYPQQRALLTQALKNLHAFTKPQQCFENSAWHRLAQRMGLANGPVETEGFNVDLPQLFVESGTQLRRIAAAANVVTRLNATEADELREPLHTLLTELAGRIDVCGPGVISNVADAHKQLMTLLDPPDAEAHLEGFRLQMARQMLACFASRHLGHIPHFKGNEIHIVTALQNHFAQRHNLPVIDDRYASFYFLQDIVHELPQLDMAMSRCLSMESIAARCAEDILLRISAGQDSGEAISYPRLVRDLDSLEYPFGPICPTLVCKFDADFNPIQLITHPLLLTRHILNRIQPEACRTGVHLNPDEQQVYWSGDNLDRVELCQNKALLWKSRPHIAERTLEPIQWEDLFTTRLVDLLEKPETHDMGLHLIHEAILNKADSTIPTHSRYSFLQLTTAQQRTSLWCTLNQLKEESIAIQRVRNALASKVDTNDIAAWILHPAGHEVGLPALTKQLDTPGMLDARLRGVVLRDGSVTTRTLLECIVFLCKATARGQCYISPELHRAALERFPPERLSSLPVESVRAAGARSNTAYFLNVQRVLPDGVIKATELLGMLELFRDVSVEVIQLLAKQMNEKQAWLNTDQEDLSLALRGISKANMSDTDTHTALQTALTDAPEGSIFQRLTTPALLALIVAVKPRSMKAILTHPSWEWTPENIAHVWRSVDRLVRSQPSQDQMQCEKVVTRLQKHGLPLDQTPIQVLTGVCRHGPVSLMTLMLNGRNRSHPDPASFADSDGNTLLHHAVARGQLAMMNQILRFNPKLTANRDGKTALETALDQGQVEMAVALYRHLGDLNTLKDGYAPLHRAILDVPAPPMEVGPAEAIAMPEIQFAITRITALIGAGANPNGRCNLSHAGKTALHLAGRIVNPAVRDRIIALLIQHGANPNALDYKRRPAVPKTP